MAYGLLVIRAVVGCMLAAHGAQKLFGWFDGSGLNRTAKMFPVVAVPGAVPDGGAGGTALAELGGAAFAIGFLDAPLRHSGWP